VEVDLDTGETRVLARRHRRTSAGDPSGAVRGQIEGGTLQGLGWALLEDVRWKDGRVWNHQLTNYIIPTSPDSPPIDVAIVEIPYSLGPARRERRGRAADGRAGARGGERDRRRDRSPGERDPGAAGAIAARAARGGNA
jgi:hypothetical protein